MGSGLYVPHPDDLAFGIDVSKWNPPEKVNWAKAKAEGGVRFGWAKVSEGDFRDPACVRHLTAADDAGVAIGGYHFNRRRVSPSDQAKIFTSSNFVRRTLAMPFAPMLDVEEPYFDHKNPPPWSEVMRLSYDVETHAADTADAIEQITGVACTIYTGSMYFAHRTERLAKGRPLFVAQYYLSGWSVTSRPRLPLAWSNWAVWQFRGDDGRVVGVEGPCDCNLFNGNFEALQRWNNSLYLGAAKEVLPTHEPANTEAGSAWKLFRAVDAIREDYSDEQETYHRECFNFGMNRGRNEC